MSQEIDVLLIGGRGHIGSGLRTYMPLLDNKYHMTSIDLPGAANRLLHEDTHTEFIDLDICSDPNAFFGLVDGRDLIVYLARRNNLGAMNRMTDLVFKAVLAQQIPPFVIGSSSVHAVDGLYNFNDENSVYWTIADRRFADVDAWPARISAGVPAHAINDYGREKAYVEKWVRQVADRGHSAIAARWGGINSRNDARANERGYFSVWCHQQDAANLVHACFRSHRCGDLHSGSHYFVISDNTYNIFDIDTPRREVGYKPQHNAESYYYPQVY